MKKQAHPKPPVKLWLDSGAFSVWQARKKGKKVEPISLPAYIDFIKQREHLIECYISLDEMPHRRDMGAMKHSARTSYEQHQVMKKAGLSPMPVFHQGEDTEWLDRYIGDGEQYIGLSGWKGPRSAGPVRKWCNMIFRDYPDRQIRFHGLGIMEHELLCHYPWFSVDSTTWALKSGYGYIIVPAFEGDKPNFLQPPRLVHVSDERRPGTRRFEMMSDAETEPVCRWLDWIELNITQCRNEPDMRRRSFVCFYEGLSRHLDLTIVFATQLSGPWSVMMNNVGAMNRLLSYYLLRDKGPDLLEDYVMLRGKFAEAPVHRPAPNWGSAHVNWRRMRLAARLRDHLNNAVPVRFTTPST